MKMKGMRSTTFSRMMNSMRSKLDSVLFEIMKDRTSPQATMMAEVALATMMSRHHEVLMSRILKYTRGNIQDAFDIGQEAWISFWTKSPTLHLEELKGQTILAYITAIARNIYINQHRAQKRLPRMVSLDILNLENLDMQSSEIDPREYILLHCLDELDPKMQAFLLLLLDGWDRQKLASHFGVTVRTISRWKERLKDLIQMAVQAWRHRPK